VGGGKRAAYLQLFIGEGYVGTELKGRGLWLYVGQFLVPPIDFLPIALQVGEGVGHVPEGDTFELRRSFR